MTTILCDNCQHHMKFVKRMKNTKPSRRNPKGYRIRRFNCDICDIQKTIFADGVRDTEIDPYFAIEEAKDLDKQRKENE